MQLFTIILLSSIGVLALTASAADITSSQPAVGDGSESNPYQITSAGELYWFAEYVNAGNASACAKLMNDITVNENVIVSGVLNSDTGDLVAWTPIGVRVGASTKAFSGTFDGGNHTISGLYVSDRFYGEWHCQECDCGRLLFFRYYKYWCGCGLLWSDRNRFCRHQLP